MADVKEPLIRVGRRLYHKKGHLDPSYPGYIPIICLTKDTEYGSLSPYEIRTKEGWIFENYWQAKCYESVPYVKPNWRDGWEHKEEIHIRINEKGERYLTPEFYAWRQKLLNWPKPVRYPVGYEHRHKCVGYVIPGTETIPLKTLDYITARKEVYVKMFMELVRKQPQYQELLQMLRQGKKLLIVDVDAAFVEEMPYYRQKYGVGEDFIVNNTVAVTHRNMEILINDPKKPFGHTHALAMALLDDLKEMSNSKCMDGLF